MWQRSHGTRDGRAVTKKYTFRFQNEAYMYMRENNYMMLSAIDIDDEDQ